MLSYILIFIIPYLSITKQVCTIEISGFDAIKWRADSTGCRKDRFNLVDILVEKKDKIISHNRSEVLSLLGKPNEINKEGNGHSYYIEAGVQCLPHGKHLPRPLDVARLIVRYEGDKVIDVYIMTI